ncbi:MAG: AMP-dependent synthetase/ligase [Thiotrichales bacterium]
MKKLSTGPTDIINVIPELTIPAMFRERVKRSGDAEAYRQFNRQTHQWESFSWEQTQTDVARWQAMLKSLSLKAGDRVGIMSPNRREWALLDLAAQSTGLIVVPLYNNDRGENAAWILNHSECRVLLIEGESQWKELAPYRETFPCVEQILSLEPVDAELGANSQLVTDLLPAAAPALLAEESAANEVATIVYTSGTTGKPKGVMLSHQNILTNAAAGLELVPAYPTDLFLSFLPLSHMLERMAGYYLAMLAGSAIAYSRSIAHLAEDFTIVKPTVIFSVPRIYERVYSKLQDQLERKSGIARKLFELGVKVGEHQFEFEQKRAKWGMDLLLWPLLRKLVAAKLMEKLGGRLRVAITGGAALPAGVSRVFTALHIPLLQGYGLTETSPLISVNTFENNIPDSVGLPIPGIEVKVQDDGELLVRGPNVMLGYWKNEQATNDLIDPDGWLATGDLAKLADGHLYIVGRKKEIIVLSTGEKVPPADMELVASSDPLFEQVVIFGEAKPYLVALVVVNPERWEIIKNNIGNVDDLQQTAANKYLHRHLSEQLRSFPGYARIHRAWFTLEPWTIENGMMTPTLKLRRQAIEQFHEETIKRLYKGHR